MRSEADRYVSSLEAYLTAVHWSLTQFHASMELQPHTTNERAFAVGVVLFGLTYTSVFVALFTNMIFQLQSLCQERTRQQQVLRNYLKDHNISNQLTVRVKQFILTHVFDETKQENEVKLLETLPADLLADLHEEARAPFIARQDFFGLL